MFIPRMKIALVSVILFSSFFTFIDAFASMGRVCAGTKFSCKDGSQCVPHQWTCDGDPDCDDGSDELAENCMASQARNCTSTEFQCDSYKCLPLAWRCDGSEDCKDKTDEQHCVHSCKDTEFKCASGQCITSLWKCDGFADCNDKSDEDDCPEKSDEETSTFFFCSDGHRLPLSYKCDGDQDCADGKDEAECGESTVKSTTACLSSEFQCSPTYCIAQSWVCDGRADCQDAKDEQNCAEKLCQGSEFKCSSGECVKLHERCDRYDDCSDGSDEEGCDVKFSEVIPTNGTASVCDNSTSFMCSSGKCISKEKLCDEKDDCGNNEDESSAQCGVNECERNNGGCQHQCNDTKTGYTCHCNKGFRLIGKYSCDDIDECVEVPGSCSQLCINTKGSFHCSCQPGYLRDPTDYTRCKAAVGEPYLIFSHNYDIRSIRLRDKDMSSVVSDTTGATALDFHYDQNQILWSDQKQKKIFRANMSNTNMREVIVAEQDVSAEGLAVDWIHGHIYYTETNMFAVRMISWDHKHTKTLFKQGLEHPRSIAVSPSTGYLYWSDWGSEPKIERSGLDGSNRQKIIGDPHVAWPNGITLDHSNDRLYWCDGRLNTISSSRLDGSQIEIILFSPSVLRLPYSISVFEDRMYWTDWSKLALYSANKFDGGDVLNITAGHMLESPKVVHVYHQYRQPTHENICESHSCSHMCVRSTFATAICMCPDGFILQEDGLVCIDGQEEEAEAVTAHKSGPRETVPELDENIYPSHANSHRQEYSNSPRVYISEPDEVNYRLVTIVTGLCVALLALALIAVMAVMYLRRRRPRSIKRFRFNNPVYRKTTEDETDDDRGFTIGQEQLFYNPTREYNPPDPTLSMTEADDAPLTPEDQEV